MITTIQRWGNSLAIRIPKAFAAQAKLEDATQVDLVVRGDSLVIKLARKEWKLAELIDGISDANIHKAVDWGEPAGKEVW